MLQACSLSVEVLRAASADVVDVEEALLAMREVRPAYNFINTLSLSEINTAKHVHIPSGLINLLAFRDREAGSASNRAKAVDDGLRSDRHPKQGGRGQDYESRGGRGTRGHTRGGRGAPGDRHTRGLPKYAYASLRPTIFH